MRIILERIKNKELFIVEGEKIVREALSQNFYEIEIVAALKGLEIKDLKIKDFGVTKDFGATNRKLVRLSEKDFKRLSDARNPQGILAVVRRKKIELDKINSPVVIIGESVNDPGNVGTLIRSAHAFGAEAVFTKKSADIFNPKSVRASAGSVLHIRVVDMVEIKEAVDYFRSQNYKIYAASSKGGEWFFDGDDGRVKNKSVFIIGSESKGLSKEALELSDKIITIPTAGKAESLNAATAGGILLYEAYKNYF
jgi:TrmH family RNA methyltransferase